MSVAKVGAEGAAAAWSPRFAGVRVVAVVPTYNEAANLEALVRGLRDVEPGIGIVIVDDASEDGTSAAAHRLADELGDIAVIDRAAKFGLGSAYRRGFAHAIDHGADVASRSTPTSPTTPPTSPPCSPTSATGPTWRSAAATSPAAGSSGGRGRGAGCRDGATATPPGSSAWRSTMPPPGSAPTVRGAATDGLRHRDRRRLRLPDRDDASARARRGKIVEFPIAFATVVPASRSSAVASSARRSAWWCASG